MNEDLGDSAHRRTDVDVTKRVDRMLAAGRITKEEADRLRSAADADELEALIRDVRSRHASARLDAEVAEGRMSADEAAAALQSLASGGHSRFRGFLRGLAGRGARGHRPAPSTGQHPGADDDAG